MPQVPAFLADLVEPRFSRPCEITRVDALDPQLRRIAFAGESLQRVGFHAGQEIELRVGSSSFRHYTPARFDAIAGELEIVFYLAGTGPGSRWATDLAPGARVNVLGPGGRLRLDPLASTHVLLGDETCLGLFLAFANAAPVTSRVITAVELEPEREHWPALIGLAAEPVLRVPGARGNALLAWLDELAPSPRTTFYLAGHTTTIERLRKRLLHVAGRRQIRSKPYWADGKRGL